MSPGPAGSLEQEIQETVDAAVQGIGQMGSQAANEFGSFINELLPVVSILIIAVTIVLILLTGIYFALPLLSLFMGSFMGSSAGRPEARHPGADAILGYFGLFCLVVALLLIILAISQHNWIRSMTSHTPKRSAGHDPQPVSPQKDPAQAVRPGSPLMRRPPPQPKVDRKGTKAAKGAQPPLAGAMATGSGVPEAQRGGSGAGGTGAAEPSPVGVPQADAWPNEPPTGAPEETEAHAPEAPPPPPPVRSPEPIAPIKPVRIEDLPPREPDDPKDLADHPHERIYPASDRQPSELRDGWHIVGASRRGLGHAVEGKYRDDDFAVKLIDSDLALVAIADGVSAKAYSRRGAREAVLGATTLKPADERQLRELVRAVRAVSSHPTHETRTRDTLAPECVLAAMQRAYDAVARYAQEQAASGGPITSVDDLQSTLIVFLVIPFEVPAGVPGIRQRPGPYLFIAATQAGDGAIYMHAPTSPDAAKAWKFLLTPQIQATGNEVQPFMRTTPEDWRGAVRMNAALPMDCELFAMTDGIADDIEPPHPGPGDDPNSFNPYVNVDRFYQEKLLALREARHLVARRKPAEAAQRLVEYIGYRQRASFDDRTLVCVFDLFQSPLGASHAGAGSGGDSSRR